MLMCFYLVFITLFLVGSVTRMLKQCFYDEYMIVAAVVLDKYCLSPATDATETDQVGRLGYIATSK